MKKMRTLIIDDDLCPGIKEPNGNVMWYYKDALSDQGYDTKEAIDPDEALEILSEDNSFDLIILDIMLPPGKTFKDVDTLDGLRTGVHLAVKLNKQYPKIPVLVLTNVSDPVLKEKMGFPNIKEIIQKEDCTPYELVDKVKILSRS